MKIRSFFLCIALICLALPLTAQSIWNRSHLEQVKASVTAPAYAASYEVLTQEADKLLDVHPLSVMMKEKAPASGNKHDYMSQARYYWTDPSRPDGRPYVERDGLSNPELEKLDRVRLGQTADRVITLSLAWYFSGEEKYADKATELLRVWFLNKDTRMNPHLTYAQVAPGHNNDQGRCYGVLDAYSFVEMLDAVQLLEDSRSFTSSDARQLKAWFGKLLDWMLTSEQGIDEGRQANNHSTAYDAQVIAYALYTGKKEVATRVLNEFPEKRIFTQIEPDGRQPHELRRTLAFGYSQYNLRHMIDIFEMGHKIGVSIENSVSTDGRGFYKAMDFLAQYMGKEVSDWPYKQISDWDGKQQEFAQDLYRTWLFSPDRKDYLRIYRENRRIHREDRFYLLYFQPTVVDHAFAFADVQLRLAMKSTEQAQKEYTGNKRLVAPRCIEKDGSLRLIGARDWCSGFFPGSLWHMYAYSNENTWREQAVTYTWPLEEVKWHRGTHDLGFMVYCSFGKAYELTGEQSYRDVVMQAARTLRTRYNDQVKAIRSWDFNRQVWQYPVIIDNMLNLELLFRATEISGDSAFYHIAVNHANTTLKHHFRDDYSSYHVVDYDTLTGEVRLKDTHQGHADDSFWSRGQAWGMYGYTLCYRFTRDPAYLRQAEAITDFFYGLPDMPEDKVPYWDMKDPRIPHAPRDASAAAIFASGLYELSTYVTGEKAIRYRELADTLVENLSNDYQTAPGTHYGFLLLHSTGHHPGGDEIDVPIVYADYYYLEALSRKERLDRK